MGDKRNAVSGHIQLFLTIILQNLQVRAAFSYVKYEWIMAPSSGLSRVKLVTFQCQIRRDINDYRFSRILSVNSFSGPVHINTLLLYQQRSNAQFEIKVHQDSGSTFNCILFPHDWHIDTWHFNIWGIYTFIWTSRKLSSYLGQLCFIIQRKHSRLGIIDSTNGGRGFASRAKN